MPHRPLGPPYGARAYGSASQGTPDPPTSQEPAQDKPDWTYAYIMAGLTVFYALLIIVYLVWG